MPLFENHGSVELACGGIDIAINQCVAIIVIVAIVILMSTDTMNVFLNLAVGGAGILGPPVEGRGPEL